MRVGGVAEQWVDSILGGSLGFLSLCPLILCVSILDRGSMDFWSRMVHNSIRTPTLPLDPLRQSLQMNNKLDQQLAEFRALLARSEHLEPETLEALGDLAGDIQQLLESKDPNLQATEGHSSVSERLSDWIDRFELEHPELTRTLSQVAERLADMGI